VATLALLGLVLALGGTKLAQIRRMLAAAKSQVRPPVSVATTQVREIEWQPTLKAVGTVVAVRGVTLGAEVTGTVERIEFRNGASVDEGQPLVQLDSAAEQARLRSALAREALARQNLRRARILRRQDVNTEADLQSAQAADEQARAEVASLRATIAKKTIRAPFAGRVGIREVELGQVVSPGTPIVSLQTVSPIQVDFWLPEQALARVEVGDRARVTVDVFPGSAWNGTVETINPAVDAKTRNVRIRLTLPNPDARLVPGMFAEVSVSAGEPRLVRIVPQTAILYAPDGDSVFVLDQKRGAGPRGRQARGGPSRHPNPSASSAPIARRRLVRLGHRCGDDVVVASGLTAGETVVSMGAFKLEEGDRVVVHNGLAPRFSLHPEPANG
jgi:membrane fusion protein (multidrug efflux system)